MSFISGVGEGAFETVEQFEHYLKPSVLKLTYHDCDAADRIVAFFMFYPSPLSRSFRPVNLGKYSNINCNCSCGDDDFFNWGLLVGNVVVVMLGLVVVPSGGSNSKGEGAPTYYLIIFFKKLHENEEILARGERVPYTLKIRQWYQ